jgi:hypothetical protein
MKNKKNPRNKGKKVPKKAAASKSQKSSKLDDISQTHGKVEEDEPQYQPTTLDQIWGDDGTSKYGTLSEKTYTSELDELGLTDLHAHAAEVGIIPIDNRDMLEKRLIREFNKHANQYRKPMNVEPLNNEDTSKIPKKVWDILKEGR